MQCTYILPYLSDSAIANNYYSLGIILFRGLGGREAWKKDKICQVRLKNCNFDCVFDRPCILDILDKSAAFATATGTPP